MKPVMAPPFSAARRARQQSGFALIEVIVSAAVLALVALAVLSGIDGAMSSTGREKARSIAASLAEKDQERLRTLPVEQLATYGVVNTPFTVQGSGNYNVQSKVEWVRDATGGTVSCANDDSDADYLHITSTVTSNVVGTRTKAVQIDSIVAPNVEYSTTHGSLAVKVVDRDGDPVQGASVTATGPVTLNGLTNEQGCALFQMIPVGDYTVTVSKAGYIDRFGNATPSKTVTVPAGQLVTLTFEMDAAGSVAATIESYKPGSTAQSSSTIIASVANRISAENGDEASLLRNEPIPGPLATAAASITANNLYPFTAQYSFYTGTCRYSNPTYNDANSGYFGTFPGAVAVDPGSPATVKIRQPPLNLRLTNDRSGGAPANNMRVVARPVQPSGDSCVEPPLDLKTFTVSGNAGVVGRSQPTPNGFVEAGVPFGYYTVCFERGTGTGANPYRYTVWPTDNAGTVYDNTNPFGKPTTDQYDATATGKWHGGRC